MSDIDDKINSLIDSDCLNKYNNKNVIVLSGGSFKGLAYVGVIKALDKMNIRKYLNIFVGTSIGSIFAFLLSLNSYIEEIEEFINSLDFNKLFKFNIKNLYCNYGLNNGDNIIKILEDFTIKKNYNANLTFQELKNKTNNTLIINASNITKRQNEIFDYINTPNLEIIKAIRMSISIPFVFTPFEYNNCLYVDGGITNSFMYNYTIKTLNIKENKIIGVLLNDEINDNKSFNSYLMNIYYSLYSHMYDEIDMNNIIVITIKNCNISTFKINKKDIQNMIDIGYQKTIEYFKTKNNP